MCSYLPSLAFLRFGFEHTGKSSSSRAVATKEPHVKKLTIIQIYSNTEHLSCMHIMCLHQHLQHSPTFSKHLEHRSHHLNRQNIIQHHTLTTTINNYNKIQHHGHHLSLNPDVLSCPQGQEWQLHSVGLANGVYRCLHGRAKETKPR